MTTAAATRGALRRLARVHGIQLSYTANDGHRVRTSTASIEATLTALGVAVAPGADLDQLATDTVRERYAQPLQPVVVSGPRGRLSTPVIVPATADLTSCWVDIELEQGGAARGRLADLVVEESAVAEVQGARALVVSVGALDLPAGYHELRLDGVAGRSALLVVPPVPVASTERAFGVFAPVYGLRGSHDWGVGSFTELRELADHVGALGAAVVGTLPMYPLFFTPPVDPSPYLPVSRLFVNELFVDLAVLPEFTRSEAARSLAGSAPVATAVQALRQLPRTDYSEVMMHKRQVLEACADNLFYGASDRKVEFDKFLEVHPELAAYADFRAAAEKLGDRWNEWGGDPGTPPAGAVDPKVSRYHRYVQFVASEQLTAASQGQGAGLYLDLPVGVHPHGFDTWSRPDAFAGATVGAPPDRLAPEGQAWGFPPLHPQRIREQRYSYVISCFRHLVAHARAVRIDHALGMQRMFWIPAGADATAGAYVKYRVEELFAILSLEASRADCTVVGEDLGTVSAGIKRAMDQAEMLHSFVYQFAASAQRPFPQPTTPSMASLGSHDLARFAGFWRGSDIADRVDRGVTPAAVAAGEQADRQELADAVAKEIGDASTEAAFAACIGSLAAGPAPYLMVDLADLVGETEPDNRPGTGPEAANWRWRIQRPLQAILDDPAVTDAIRSIAAARQQPTLAASIAEGATA